MAANCSWIACRTCRIYKNGSNSIFTGHHSKPRDPVLSHVPSPPFAHDFRFRNRLDAWPVAGLELLHDALISLRVEPPPICVSAR